MRFFLCLCIFLFHSQANAQLKKSDWLIKGNFNFQNNSVIEGISLNFLTLDLDVGFLLSDHFAVGAGLELLSERRHAVLVNALWGRYYFQQFNELSPFVGLRYEKELDYFQRQDKVPPFSFKRDRVFGLLGFNYTLHQFLSLEGSYNFGFFETTKARSNSQLNSGTSNFDITLKLTLPSNRMTRDTFQFDNIKRGKKIIGGQIEFNPRELNMIKEDLQIDFQPLYGFFWRNRILLGGKLNISYVNSFRAITTGLQPFIRYYLPIGNRKALFAELSVGYDHILKQERTRVFISDHQFGGTGGLGCAIFINHNLSLDVQLSQSYQKRYFNFSSQNAQNDFVADFLSTELSFGLQFYLN